MAWIPYVAPSDAEGVLSKLYKAYGGESGELDTILRIHSLNPRSLKDHVELYTHLMRGRSPLSRIQREMIAVAVSGANDCFY
jgi:alkylhydroperoxidase family enzyme